MRPLYFPLKTKQIPMAKTFYLTLILRKKNRKLHLKTRVLTARQVLLFIENIRRFL